jgi:hypothetical protein
MRIELESVEIGYLLKLIAEHRTYYATLAALGIVARTTLDLINWCRELGRKLG